MVGCSAFGCSNRSEQGYLMKVFPKDPSRRKEWAAKVKREGWIPTHRSYLCEVHFEPHMWEKTREDGSRKLKWNAVPTIFSFAQPKPKRKEPAERSFRHEGPPILEPTETNICREMVIPEVSEDQYKMIGSDGNALLEGANELRQKAYKKVLLQNHKLRNKMRVLKRKYDNDTRNKATTVEQQDHLLHIVFNKDQIQALQRKSMKFTRWSHETIVRALKLKFSCGAAGYRELLVQNIPLPSMRTLRRRLETISFDSGILFEVFEFLKTKVAHFEGDHARDCVLVLDEMAITPSHTYDNALNKYLGSVTLPGHSGVATHALTIMLGGITLRWKQTVAYYFTGTSVNGAVFKDILFEIITRTENLGLKVISITSDMGSSNQALWKVWNITSGRYSKTVNSIPHPCDPARKMYILADVPHLFKNIKNMFVSNKIIKISDETKEHYNLPNNIVNADHIQELIQYQKDLRFQLAPKVTEEDLTPSHFQKMKVKCSSNVVSHSVSSALKFISSELKKPEYLTTAWFLNIVERWFKLMTSRHRVLALSKTRPEKYDSEILFLKDFMNIFQTMQVGEKMAWKPSQTGVLISTQSILDIQNVLLGDRGNIFLLTSRFTQDCLENLFSAIRCKQLIPNAVQFKNNLKLITIAQYLCDVSHSSYDSDDRAFLNEFLSNTPASKEPKYSPVKLPSETPDSGRELNNPEVNSLYNLAGYLVSSIKKTTKCCSQCVDSVGSNTFVNMPYSQLVNIKCFNKNTLFYCNNETFNFFHKLEMIFEQYYDVVCKQNINLKKFFVNKMCESTTDIVHIETCHNLKLSIISRFVTFRLKISSKKKMSVKQKVFASKSVMSSQL